MKNIFFSIGVALTLVMSLVSCDSNSPKPIADKWLNGLYHLDYKSAKEVSTDDTKQLLETLEQFSTIYPDSVKEEMKKIKVDIKDVKEEGDKATVTYTTSDEPSEKTLNLVKQNGKWLVKWTKQDQMGDAAGDEMEEPAMSDSTTVIEGDPTNTTPSTADTAVTQ